MRRSLLLLLLLLSVVPQGADAKGLLINGARALAGSLNQCDSVAGAANAYECTIVPDPVATAYADQQCFLFRAHAANTGAATYKVNARAATPIKNRVAGRNTDLVANDIG